MNNARSMFLVAVAALVVLLAIFTSDALGATTYHSPNGPCMVYQLGESGIRDALTVCVSNVPDMTGDGIPEQEIRLLETRKYGRLSCASHILFDPTCPTTGACTRYLSIDRTCF